MTRADVRALLIVLSLSTLFILSKFDNELVHDDLFVIGGSLIHDPSRIFEGFSAHTLIAHDGPKETQSMDTYRPVGLLTFFWDAWISGREPWSYHLTNHIVHLGSIATLYALARALLPHAAVWSIAISCLFFGLSPQLAEAHVWINGRSDPLATLFGLLALFMWHRSETAERRRYLWLSCACLSLMLGLLCKEVLLLGMASLVIFPRKDSTLRTRVVGLVPFALVSLTYLGLRTWALSGLRATGLPGQLSRALSNLPVLWIDGLRELFLPSRLYLRNLREEYALISDVERGVYVALVLLLAALLFRFRRRVPVLAWGAAWYACTLAPAAMISVVLWPGFGRYLYIPCAGIALGLVELLEMVRRAWLRRFEADPAQATRMRSFGLAVAAIYLLALGARLAVYTEDYHDNKTLFMSAIEAAPRPAYGYAWLGGALAHAGDFKGAIPMLSEAVKRDPGDARYVHDLIRAHLMTGNLTVAISMARSAIARSPREAAGGLRVLLLWALAGPDPEGAVNELCECLTYEPTLPDCVNAPNWMLDPKGQSYERFREAFASFSQTCPSVHAQRIVGTQLAAIKARRP